MIVLLFLPLGDAVSYFAGAENSETMNTEEYNVQSRAVKKWTLFIYVDGDNNLEKFAIEDINEMELIGSTDDVNIIIQVDRVKGYDNSNDDWTDTRRYKVIKDDDFQNINSTRLDNYPNELGEKNMADPNTLKDFLIWGIENYPAEHYLVVMWDHGRGIFRGSGSDPPLFRGFNEDLTSNTQEMKLWELDEVMNDVKAKNGGRSIDILAFDQCWLGNIETAYELMDSVDYLIASADEEPDKGWNYQPPFKKLVENPNMSPEEFSIHITDDYVTEYQNKTSYSYMTQVSVDLRKLNTTFIPVMNKFSEKLIENFYEYRDILFDLRDMLNDYYYPHPDLFYFVTLVEANTSLPEGLRAAAADMISNYSTIILAEGHGSAHPNGYGLAIYFPDSIYRDPYSDWQEEYDNKIDFSAERWSEFLRIFYNPMKIIHEPLKDTEDSLKPYTIRAQIEGYKLDHDQVGVYYSSNQSELQYLNMTYDKNANEFTAEIPAQPSNTNVFYCIKASDLMGNSIFSPGDESQLSIDENHHFYVGTDTKPPEIIHQPFGDKIYSKDDFEIIVTVTDNIGVDENKVNLFYRINDDKDYIELTLKRIETRSNQYRSYIPSQLIGTVVYYYFEAVDMAIEPNVQRMPQSDDFSFHILGIIIDIARDLYHSSSLDKYDQLFDTLREPGYNITEIKTQLNRTALHNIDLLVMTEPTKHLTNYEIFNIKEYLNAGGRLMIIGGTDAEVMNEITQFLGITWNENYENFGYTGTFDKNSYIFHDVHELYYSPPALSVHADKPAVDLVLNDLETSTLALYTYYGQGKVVAMTQGLFSADSLGMSFNTIFLNNLAFWLVKCPIAVVAGAETKVNGEIITVNENNTITIFEDDFIGFDGSESIYPEWKNKNLNHSWDLGYGRIVYNEKPAKKYTDQGTFEIIYTVTTYDGFMDKAKLNVVVNNIPPQAYPGYTKIQGLSVYFDASATTDSESDLPNLIYTWDFGDGQTGTGISPKHQYRASGVYHVKLTVVDDDGETSSSIMKVDLRDKSSSKLSTYYPAIGAVFLVIIVVMFYFYIQKRSKPVKTHDDIEERIETNEPRIRRVRQPAPVKRPVRRK